MDNGKGDLNLSESTLLLTPPYMVRNVMTLAIMIGGCLPIAPRPLPHVVVHWKLTGIENCTFVISTLHYLSSSIHFLSSKLQNMLVSSSCLSPSRLQANMINNPKLNARGLGLGLVRDSKVTKS